MATYVRDSRDYGWGGEVQRRDAARRDLMLEVGTLLMLLQERRREGMTEDRNVGKWFTTRQRFGGAFMPKRYEGEARQSGYLEQWKDVKASRKTWDPKVEWMAIGKTNESPWDEVRFLLTFC